MRSNRNGQISPRLLRAAARFAQWRRTRVIGTRIPKTLWAAAVRLAGQFSIARTASCLKLDYDELKKHLESRTPSAMQTSTSVAKQTPAFVEWPASSFPTPAECVIELENAAGSKMRIQLKGSHAPDLVALSSTFWNTAQ